LSVPRAHLAWDGAGEARFVALAGDAVTLVSSASSPPGSRPTGTLIEEPRERVRVKVHGCKATEEGAFRIDGRLIDARRELRTRLEALVARDGA
jgi:hypothetical protein